MQCPWQGHSPVEEAFAMQKADVSLVMAYVQDVPCSRQDFVYDVVTKLQVGRKDSRT